MFRVLFWADPREDNKINPAPDFIDRFSGRGGHGGPRRPWERIRFDRQGRLHPNQPRRHLLIWWAASKRIK